MDNRQKNEVYYLLTRKKYWGKKQDFYHRLFHKYQRKVNLSWFVFCLSVLPVLYLSGFLKPNKWILVIFLVLFLGSLFLYVYFIKYFWLYERKLENCSYKISQINEKLIEIMVSSRITNPTV